MNNCTKKEVRINDVYCTEFTGPNGNTLIFTNESGQGYKSNTSLNVTFPQYWTATIHDLGSGQKSDYFTPLMTMPLSAYRSYGMQVRPICVDRNAVDANDN